MVRDGRLQAPKKRTDRSYLRPTPSVDEEILPEDAAPDETLSPEAALPESAEATPEAAEAAPSEPATEIKPPAPRPAPTPAPVGARAATAPVPGRLPTSVRAIQQQGVRKRREIDLHALAVRDTKYAVHEVRRIFVLTVMVIISLVVLTMVLR